MERVRRTSRTRGKILGSRYEFPAIMIIFMIILLLAIWVAHSDAKDEPIPFQILKEIAEREMAIETWEKIMAIEGMGKEERDQIERVVFLFIKNQIEWNCGYTPTHIHPAEGVRGAQRLLWYTRELASQNKTRLATPLEWEAWQGKYSFHYKVVGRMADINEWLK